MLILTILALGPRLAAISSSAGPIILQGPHHSAQKSTTTGVSDWSTSFSKDASDAWWVDIENLMGLGGIRRLAIAER